MGKKSIRENKTVWQLSREEAGLTREKASEVLEYISADRIEKIESEKVLPHPEEALTMAEGYKNPFLRNHYCAHECPIGQRYTREIPDKPISQITLELLNSINQLSAEKDRLVEIALNGTVTIDEVPDFVKIKAELDNIAIGVDTLQLWLEKMEAEEKLTPPVLEELKKHQSF